MKGIYLTQEGKQEIEAKIAEIENEEDINSECWGISSSIYQQILASATILPVEESWNDFYNNSDSLYNQEDYPNGVIIQPKK